MKHVVWFLLSTVTVSLLATGCGVTPMFNPPLPENTSQEQMAADMEKYQPGLLGKWRCENEVEAEITVEDKSLGALCIAALTRDGDNGMKPLPCTGAVFEFGGEPYLIFFATPEFDNPALGSMLRANFYAAKLDFQDDGSVIFNLITWRDKNKNPTAPELSFETDNDKPGDTVLNSSSELGRLLAEKQYAVARTMRFTRMEK